MNRENFWIHLCIAVVVISFAAILGQIGRWRSIIKPVKEASKSAVKSVPRKADAGEPELLVKFKQNISLSEIIKIAAKNNDRVEDEIETVNNLVSIDDLDNADVKSLVEQYRQMSDFVEYAEPNYEIKVDPIENTSYKNLDWRQLNESNVPNDPLFAEQWSLNNVGQNGGKQDAHIAALAAWAKTTGSEKIVVAVLDTGVDYTHTDLAVNMWSRPDSLPAYRDDELGTVNDLRGFNADENFKDPMDDNGHGTHCAGIIGAEGNNDEGIAGINWRVEIMPLKFLGRGGFGSTKNAIESINYAIQRKRDGVNLRIISASWGSTAYSKALEDAIRAAGEEGILFVAAAGNNSSSNDRLPHYPSNYNLPNVISVAALDRNDELASFSNFGAKTVHIAAPGKEIVSTWLGGGFREASGTSMATPEISGVAALILATEPNMKVDKLRKRVLDSVDKIPALDGKVSSGGRINALKALVN